LPQTALPAPEIEIGSHPSSRLQGAKDSDQNIVRQITNEQKIAKVLGEIALVRWEMPDRDAAGKGDRFCEEAPRSPDHCQAGSPLPNLGLISALAERKVDNIIATGADYVVMANVGCQFQIAAELRRRGAKTRAIHLADFLALATQRQ
jgi:hypothetical protein